MTFKMTDTESRIQDATVALLRHHCDERDGRLRARAASAEEAVMDRLCPCGIVLSACRCPLQQWRVKRG